MAPVEEAPGGAVGAAAGVATALGRYLDESIPGVVTEYDRLWDNPDPEENPYKSKYAGRKLLQDVLSEIRRLTQEDPSGPDTERGSEMAAKLLLHLGKNFYWCEETAEGEQLLNRSLERYLKSPRRTTEPGIFVSIQDCLNQLGMVWCHRHDHATGMNFLRRAQIMYQKRPISCDSDQVHNQYTLTQFYLAQAYGGLQKAGLSARFCAETMSRQLKYNTEGSRSEELVQKDPFDCKEWVRNCCTLSDYFTNECMFWTAEYVLHSALFICDRCEEICGLKPDSLEELRAEVQRDLGIFYATRLKFARTYAANPEVCEEVWRGDTAEKKRKKNLLDDEDVAEVEKEGARLTFRCSADQGGERRPERPDLEITWDDIFPEVVFLEDEEAADNKLAEEAVVAEGASGEDIASTGHFVLDLGSGKQVSLPVHFPRLHEGVSRRIQRANVTLLGLIPSETDGAVRRSPLCVGSSFAAARELFKLSNHFFLRSLEYFLLDGWVTEHVKVLQELSQMYRTLQHFETDGKRLAAMAGRRVRMLAPLLDQLNPKVYIAFFRQLSLEVAEVFQEIYELRVHRSGAPDDDDADAVLAKTPKLAAWLNDMAEKAVTYYGRFIDSYHTDDVVPDTIDKDNARAYLTARLNRARLRTKMAGQSLDQQLERHRLSLAEYEWIQGYGRRHPEVSAKDGEIGMWQEIALCDEMVGMLPSKLSRLAAKRR